ncbi:D-3-phosphoglycerate dehydrogenase SerA [soil metagenome]
MRALVTAEFDTHSLLELNSLGYETTHAGWGVTRHPMDRDELIAALRGVEVLICELETVDGPVLSASKWRLGASCRGDPTNVDLAAAAERGVVVLSTPGRNAISVADFTLGLLISHARRIGRAEAQLRERGWLVEGELPYFHFRGPELDGRSIGLVGLGAIGRLVAARARGFGMVVLAHDPFVTDAPPGVELVALDELLARSDVVSLHCPLTPATHGLIGERELGLMRAGAILVNTARAAIVDEAALLAALRSRGIGGAALDVFWEEPLAPDHPIRDLDNVTITPHVAGAADDVRRHQARMILDDLARWQQGMPLAHAVVKLQGATP